ncbi:MAG: ATP-dependent helicase [Acidimicrobiia bacterium]|nr:ATP-dependent helicase [Acidimicrobiia bacterium]
MVGRLVAGEHTGTLRVGIGGLYEHILDNRDRGVADYLREPLRDADLFRAVSAFFTIYGFELLEDVLGGVGTTRFLFGDPTSVDRLDPAEKDPRFFTVTEEGLLPGAVLRQKHLARRCAEWIEAGSVGVKAVSRSGFLHGKMYLTDSRNGDGAAVVGSSNFTKRGLGGGEFPNLEINLATVDPLTRNELGGWFDELWNDPDLTRDAKDQVLAALRRVGREHSPEFVYYKTLFELFRDDIDARLVEAAGFGRAHLYDTQIWETLFGFQQDGVRSVLTALDRHNGCILADSVGLGKTYTALGVIKYSELLNERVLVLCPRKLRDNWSLFPAHVGHRDNPFPEDRFAYTLLSHTDLSRERGRVGDVDLAHFNWDTFDLVVIDESHNFRNDAGQRYQQLINNVIASGAQTKVLMLSATPVNTSLIDLRNQVYLMTSGRADTFRESLGIGNIAQLLNAAQKKFKKWETEQGSAKRDKKQLLESLGPDLFRLLGAVSIARSRRQIKQFYAAEIDRIGQFPAHDPPDNRHPLTDLHGELSYKQLADQINRFELSIYRPSDYLVDETRKRQLVEERQQRNFNQQDRERFLIGMIRTNFLKRLESSAFALTRTLRRTIGKIDDLVDRIDRFQGKQDTPGDVVVVVPDEDEDDDDFLVNQAKYPYRLSELDLDGWRPHLIRDRAVLNAALDQVQVVTTDRDGKLREIRKVIRAKAERPTTDLDGRTNRKVLVFTTFEDTAAYLYDNLTDLVSELGLNMAMVSGTNSRTTYDRNDFNSILTNFAPKARNRRSDHRTAEIDVLIGTDCISEGQNLQDCDTVINYDIHWNPVRLIQRLGRIDRIGSRNPRVRMVNFWPTKDMDAYLRLENRVRARMALADMTASGDSDPLIEEGIQLELQFRDEQLLKLREEIIDLDDLNDTLTMSDFTLDYFFAQLLRFLEKNRAELEATPNGVYAVAEPSEASPPGVVFVLRQRSEPAGTGQRLASPVHPYYLVYIQNNGQIGYSCANTRQVLEAIESASIGQTEPLHRLCDQFNNETDNGNNMERYNKLLNTVVEHIARRHDATQRSSLGLSGTRESTLSRSWKTPRTSEDFDLVTWLVVAPPNGPPS